MIPVCDPREQYCELKQEIDQALASACDQAKYILGPEVGEFEREVAAFTRAKHAIGVANGTDALHLALRALKIGPGDEVITTTFTFVATTEAIGMVGATPIFVDIDPKTFNLNIDQVAEKITDRTKVLLPVHLFGQPVELDPLKRLAKQHGLKLVEDCAQSFGALYRGLATGTIGDLGCFSFFPSKNLGALGDAGMVLASDGELAGRVEMLRRHGGRVKYHHEELGLNSRLDELQAAVLRIKLKRIEAWNRARRRIAYRYNEALSRFDELQLPYELVAGDYTLPTSDKVANPGMAESYSVYHQYSLLVHDRDGFGNSLKAKGVGTAVYYPIPLHLQEVHREMGNHQGKFPISERIAQQIISLPMYPHLTEAQQDHVIRSIEDVLLQRRRRVAA